MGAAVIKTVEIAGQNYRLAFKFGTMVQAERELGAPVPDLFKSGKIGFDVLGAIFWAVLQPAHRITREASEDLVDDLGVDALAQVLKEGIGAYFGAATDAAEAHDKGTEVTGGKLGKSPKAGKAPAS